MAQRIYNPRIQIATELDDPDTDFLVYYDENNDINEKANKEETEVKIATVK